MKYVLMICCFLAVGTFLAVPTQKDNEGTFTDARDGHVYKWVKIGNQTWMAENLAYLPQVYRVGDSQFSGKRFYVYGYDDTIVSKAILTENYKKYGVMYNWDAARECCPVGWHLPTEEEWCELEKYLGMNPDVIKAREWRSSGDVGKKLKSATGWKINMGSDEFKFNALPGGCRGYGGFSSIDYCSMFWSATPAGNEDAWRRGFCCDDNGSYREEERRYFGLSVRCVKDK